MSKLSQKIAKAHKRGVHVFKWPAYVGRQPDGTVWAGDIDNEQLTGKKVWAVYAEGEWYPRVGFTKREAANVAYATSISKKIKLEVTLG